MGAKTSIVESVLTFYSFEGDTHTSRPAPNDVVVVDTDIIGEGPTAAAAAAVYLLSVVSVCQLCFYPACRSSLSSLLVLSGIAQTEEVTVAPDRPAWLLTCVREKRRLRSVLQT